MDLRGLLEGTTAHSVSSIRFSCRHPGAETFVDCAGDVVRATLNGRDLDPADVADARLPLRDLAADNHLVVDMVQTNTESRTGIHRSIDPADKYVYVWMSFEPDDARRVWACFDQPDLKAPHTFTVQAPESWQVVSNSGTPSIEDEDDGRRWTFDPTPPLSTYVPVINAGPFYEVRRERDGFDLGLQCRQSLTPMLDRDAGELFDLTAAGLDFFGTRFAMPFPQRSYDQVFMPDLGGAMENYGCVTYADSFLYRSAPTESEREERAVVLLHEMAHMWFGDIVTMRWWDDLWLNEAFAEWACYWAAVNATEFTDAWATFLLGAKRVAYPADRGPTTHPIRQPAPDVATATAGFDAITYIKGASTLRQLAASLGEEAFVEGLRSHFTQHKWGNATLADLMSALADASGRDLGAWTEAWLDRSGPDTLTLELQGEDDDASVLHATGPDGTAPRPHRLDVGVYQHEGDRLVRSEVVPVQVTEESTPLPAVSGDLLLLNDGDLTFASVRPDPASLAALVSHASELPSVTARALAAVTLNDLMMTGDASASDLVDCVAQLAPLEVSDAAVEPLLDIGLQAARLWANDADRPRLEEQLAEACVALVHQGGVRRLPGLRGLAQTASRDDHLAFLAEAGHDDVDVAWRSLTRRATLGAHDEDEVARLQERDPDPDAWARAVMVEAAHDSPEAKERVWAHAFDDHYPLGRLRELTLAFWQPGQDDVLAPYVDRYLAELPEINGKGMLESMALVSWMYPYFGVRPDFVAEVTAIAEHDETTPVIRARLLEATDRLTRMLAARAR